jgi:hypothetical protein
MPSEPAHSSNHQIFQASSPYHASGAHQKHTHPTGAQDESESQDRDGRGPNGMGDVVDRPENDEASPCKDKERPWTVWCWAVAGVVGVGVPSRDAGELFVDEAAAQGIARRERVGVGAAGRGVPRLGPITNQ